MLPRTVLYCGRQDPLPETIQLRAGPLSMIFEPDDAFLRHIRMGDREILRGIYVAVRDRNWGTIVPKISNVKIESTKDAFRLTFDAECKERDIDYLWRGTIAGDPKGAVSFAMNGLARSTFLRNRIGFCVLHPLKECVGQPCSVEKADGKLERGVFPYYTSPNQPFMDMRAISHEVVPGLLAEVRFEGEVFEMEDQRNWTDASFKTYCTPLRIPIPVEIKEGTTVAQSITVTLNGQIPVETSGVRTGYSEVTFTVSETPSVPLPRIGAGLATDGQPLTTNERARLKALNLNHLRVDLHLSKPSYKETLNQAGLEANALGMSLEAALFLTDNAEEELGQFVKELDRIRPRVSTWLVFHVAEASTGERWVQLARRYLSRYDLEAKIGAGANAYFAELNRGRPPAGGFDLVSYSMNPQVHAYDNLTLVENLEGQAWTVKSARQFIGKLPLVVSPITLRIRPGVYPIQPEVGPDGLPPSVDLRQMSLFGAGWTLGSLKHISESGVQSVTYYETTGWRGVMETEKGSPSERFPSIPGAVFPLYHVLADVAEFTGGSVVPSTSNAPLKVVGIALQKADKTRVILANLSPELQYVRMLHPELAKYVRVKHLNETNAEQAMRSPESFRKDQGLLLQTSGNQIELCLLPYALVRIDPAQHPFES